MTRIMLNEGNGFFQMIVSGHAGYASDKRLPEGCDIVCSALSMISSMAMQRMGEMKEEGKLRLLNMEQTSGSVLINARAMEGTERELAVTVRTIECGFELLADRYPGNVRLLRGGGNDDKKAVC